MSPGHARRGQVTYEPSPALRGTESVDNGLVVCCIKSDRTADRRNSYTYATGAASSQAST